MTPERGGNGRQRTTVLVLASAAILALIAALWLVLSVTQRKNVALGRTTVAQSSLLYGNNNYEAFKAVDGRKDTFSSTDYDKNTNPNAWWQVDLGREYSIAEIKIWNRVDCCADRLINYYVLVLDANKATVLRVPVSGVSGVPPTPVPLTTLPIGKRGRYVRVELSNYLSLPEVEVLADVTDWELLYR
jgi:hypothetical protein